MTTDCAARRLDELRDPACYPGSATPVTVVQTHISIVCLAGDRVWKFKKPVRLPFLDFSTLDARRHWCREEVRLNRRLCPTVYLGTAALRTTPAGLRVAAVGDDQGASDLDVAVVMQRLPHDRMLDHLLAHGGVVPAEIEGLARHVAAFHATADRGPQVRAAGAPERLAELVSANFTELAALGDHGLAAGLLAALARLAAHDLQRLLPVLRQRADAGRIVDGHGDLHARNICMTVPPAVYDCIEFAPGFRCGDVATEIAFLAMDLRYRGSAALANRFVRAYAAASGDFGLAAVLPPLVRYRAMVRAKVATLAAREPDLSAADREGARQSAWRHVALAAATAVEERAPRWLLLCGPPGSGKSVLAAQLHGAGGWPVFATDAIRKELAGLPATARAPAACYTAEFSARTYGELLARATAASRDAAPAVVLDGNFATPALRSRAATAAAAVGAALDVLLVDVDEATGRARVAARATDPDRISDAGPDQYDALRARFVPPAPSEGLSVRIVDGAVPPAPAAAQALERLLAG